MNSFARLVLMMTLLALSPPCFGHGDLDELIGDVSSIIAQNPTNAALRWRRAELHRLHGDGAAAELDYAETRRLQPGLTVVDFGMAELRIAQGREEEALQYFNRFIKGVPHHAEARRQRARLLEKRGDLKAADIDLAEAAKYSPEPHYVSARAEFLVRHDRIDQAIRCLDEASRARGKVPVLEQRALEIEEHHGRVSQALSRLDRFIGQEPRPDLWLARKARLLEKNGRTVEAKSLWKEADQAFRKVPPERRALETNRKIKAEIDAGVAGAMAKPR